MATQFGRKTCAIIGRLITTLLLSVLAVKPACAETVHAENFQTFFLWSGVQPQPALNNAKEIYLLAGQVSGRSKAHIISQRSATPHIKGAKVWIVYRAQTLDWDEAIVKDILNHLETWRVADNMMVGLQIDFDAGTKHLDRYAQFLKSIREKLPVQYKLSVTGLLDWSTNGDPSTLAEVVDEVVLQIYQGRKVISNYQTYLTKLSTLQLPFKIGLLQGGDWQAPQALFSNLNFKGYVVFLVNPN